MELIVLEPSQQGSSTSTHVFTCILKFRNTDVPSR